MIPVLELRAVVRDDHACGAPGSKCIGICRRTRHYRPGCRCKIAFEVFDVADDAGRHLHVGIHEHVPLEDGFDIMATVDHADSTTLDRREISDEWPRPRMFEE